MEKVDNTEDVVNVYSIYDRLLAHWSPPYFNHSSKEFLSGLSKAINDPESNLPVALKPEHFAVWQIGQIDSGFITNIDRHLVAECSSLVRSRVRETGIRGHQEAQGAPLQGHGASRDTAGPTDPTERSPALQAQGKDQLPGAAHSRPG